MRNLLLRLALLAGVVLTIGGCADSPTQPTPQAAPDVGPGGPVMDDQVQGCVLEGLCILEPVTPAPCDPYESLSWCEPDCMTSVFQPLDQNVQGCPGGGGDPGTGGGAPPPPPTTPDPTCLTADDGTCQPGPEPVCEVDCPADGEDEADSDICPQPVRGRTLTALVNVAGRNHEFQFSGRMDRVNRLAGRSPAWYSISRPAASKDNWWIAESGTIQLVCWGGWKFRNSVWIGSISVQATDLHMVMSAGHPDF